MSSSIDLQLREYSDFFDTQLSEVTIDDIVTERVTAGPVRPLAVRRPRATHNWVVVAAAAVIVALLVGGAAVLSRATGGSDRPVATTPTTEAAAPTTEAPVLTTEPSDDPSPAVPTAGSTLEWRAGIGLDTEPLEILHDGERFLLIEPGVLRTSEDGFEWQRVAFDGPTPFLGWNSSDAFSGRLMGLVTDSGPARVISIDVASGTVDEARLPIEDDSKLATSSDLRGFVATGELGSAAFLYDNSVAPGEVMASAGFFSNDGVEWIPITNDLLLADSIVQPAATTSGFVALSEPSSSRIPTAWYSANGIQWEPIEVLNDPILRVAGVVSWADTAWAYHESAFGPPSVSVNPGWLLGPGTATELLTDLSPLEADVFGYGPATDAGALGLIAVFGVADPAPDNESSTENPQSVTWIAEFSPDGEHWTRTEIPAELGEPSAFQRPAVGNDIVLVLVMKPEGPALIVGIAM